MDRGQRGSNLYVRPNIEQTDDIPGRGDGVDSQASFIARRLAVRANPTDPTLFNFAEFQNGYANNESDFINSDLAYGELSSNGISPLAIINRTEGQFPFAANGTATGWADRWEHWQHYYVLSANESTLDRDLTFDLSALNIAAGAIVQVEEVSAGNIAEVTQRIPIPNNGRISVEQSGESVVLISVSETAHNLLTLTPTDDATVRAGSGNQTAGSSNNVFVRNIVNDTNTSNGRAVGLLQFDISGIGNRLVDRAVIEVNGEVNEGNADFVTTHVFAIRGDDWEEDTITWNDVNNLLNTSQQGTTALIADNFVTGISDTAEFVGHLTFSQDRGPVAVDITEYLKNNPDTELRLLIAREVRFDGEAADRSDGAVRFDSSDDVDGISPQLTLELTDALDPLLLGDVNLDGVVNFLDISPFIGVLSSGGFQLEADVNQDGAVDFLDISPLVSILSGG